MLDGFSIESCSELNYGTSPDQVSSRHFQNAFITDASPYRASCVGELSQCVGRQSTCFISYATSHRDNAKPLRWQTSVSDMIIIKCDSLARASATVGRSEIISSESPWKPGMKFIACERGLKNGIGSWCMGEASPFLVRATSVSEWVGSGKGAQ